MEIVDILTPARCKSSVQASSKKRTLETIAQIAHAEITGTNESEIYKHLIERERLGSTGLGQGVAIPHCRISNLSSVVGVLLQLEEGIDFESPDDQQVDLVFALMVPEEASDEHLKTLATLAEHFSQNSFCSALRHAKDDHELYAAVLAA